MISTKEKPKRIPRNIFYLLKFQNLARENRDTSWHALDKRTGIPGGVGRHQTTAPFGGLNFGVTNTILIMYKL